MALTITKTARPDIPDGTRMRRTLAAPVMNIKCVGIHEPETSGPGAGKGKETWTVEVDGQGDFEVTILIPAATNRIKDAKKRLEKVQELVLKELDPDIRAARAAHSG